MAKDTYEISIWRDVLVNGHYEEAKIAVIGSDKLKASCRAIEPKLIENINGTNTFTFKMLYQCRDPGCFPPPGIPPMPPELPYIPEVMFTVAITVPPLPVVFVAHPFSSAPETVIPTIAV